MEIAALPSCEKSLFAGAKVAFFYKRYTGNLHIDCSCCFAKQETDNP